VVSFLLAFPPISYVHISSGTIPATCPAHRILLDLIILITLVRAKGDNIIIHLKEWVVKCKFINLLREIFLNVSIKFHFATYCSIITYIHHFSFRVIFYILCFNRRVFTNSSQVAFCVQFLAFLLPLIRHDIASHSLDF
jgi:hypothetical protein